MNDPQSPIVPLLIVLAAAGVLAFIIFNILRLINRRVNENNQDQRRMKKSMTFGFKLRFLTPSGKTLKGVEIDADSPLTFQEIEGRILIRQLPRRANDLPISPQRFLIKGSGFPTEDAARSFGERLKLAIAVVGCQTGLGIDVGRDQATSSVAQSIKDEVREKQGQQLRDIIHGLDVFPEDLPVTHFQIAGTGSVSFSLEGFAEKVAVEIATVKPLPAKKSLALELYNLCLFESATKTRFLNLVTIVEVLAKRERKATPIRETIHELMESVRSSELSPDEKELLISGLGNLKRESIGAACRRTVAELVGEEEAEYFSECYKARSELLHDGQTKLQQVYDWGRLDEIVRKVLLAMIRTV
jgi:hypothetical protein